MESGRPQRLFLIVLFLQQPSVSRPETFQVLGPAGPVVAVAGEDTVLPCYLSPRISAEGLEIRWFRDEPTKPVFLYRKQRPELQDQVLTYRGRAALFLEELSKGNTSLQLTRVRGSDHGRYTCFVQSVNWYNEAVIHVSVRAVGTQTAISLETHQAQGVRLGCESKGWFPEPEVVWLDSEGQSLTADPTETHRDSQDLFTVRRQVTVQHSATNRFTCRVHQQQLNQVREAEIDVPSELFPRVSPWMVAFWVILVLVLCALVGLAMIMYRHVTVHRERENLSREKKQLIEDHGSAAAERDTLSAENNKLSTQNKALTEEIDDLTREKYTLTREKYTLNRKIDDLTREKYTLTREKYTLDREKTAASGKRGKGSNEDQEEDSSSSSANRTIPGSSSRFTNMKYGYRRY